MLESPIEVCVLWPRKRDPNIPFFVFEDETKRCVVAGTFPDGSTCLTAIPTNVKDKSWLNWTNLQQAEEAAKHLNRLHKKGQIDWSNALPKIIQDGESQEKGDLISAMAAETNQIFESSTR